MVYVDELRTYEESQFHGPMRGQALRHGRSWCHMTADNLDELHRMAERIGLKREWFQPHPRVQFAHYDLTPGKRAQAIRWGAMQVSLYEQGRIAYTEIKREQQLLGLAKKYARKCVSCRVGCLVCNGAAYTYYFVLPRIRA
jgi:hypothetical protein